MLSEKQRRFVAEYLVDLNATRAAIRAGYSRKTAKQQGARLLTNADVAGAVAEGQEKRLAKLEITADKTLQEIAKLAFANISDYITIEPDGSARVDLSKLTRDQAAAVQEITVDEVAGGAGDGVREKVRRIRFKLADKGLNLERLGRHLKLFLDKAEMAQNAMPTSINIVFVNADEDQRQVYRSAVPGKASLPV